MEEGSRSLSQMARNRGSSRDLKPLRRLGGYLHPYRWRVAGALVALVFAALAVLSLGIGLRFLIDGGFVAGHPDALNHALEAVVIVIVVLAAATFARSYLVTWLGERVVADLRRDVYDHVIRLSPAFFEVTRTGEVISRLTTDTAVIQTVTRRQRHPGAAQPAAAGRRPDPAAGHQPEAHRPGAGRGPAGGGADRRPRAAGARTLARGPGPHGRAQRRGRGDAERGPHGAVLRAGSAREPALRRHGGGGVRGGDRACTGPGSSWGRSSSPWSSARSWRALGRRPGRAGRAADGGRAVLVRVLRGHGGQCGRRPLRRVRRPPARGRGHRAAVRAARHRARDQGARRAAPAAGPAQGRGAASRGSTSSIRRHPAADAERYRARGPARRDGGAGRPVRGRQDDAVPAPDALLRPDGRAHPGRRRAAGRGRPAWRCGRISASCRRSR